jgi:hypothetical protein
MTRPFDHRNTHGSDRGKEVGSVTTVWVHKAKILEMLPSFLSWTVIQNTSLGDDGDLVELLVDSVTGLVETDDSRVPLDVGHDPKDFVESQGGIGVETSSGVVPHLNGSLTGQDLGDGHSLLFTT